MEKLLTPIIFAYKTPKFYTLSSINYYIKLPNFDITKPRNCINYLPVIDYNSPYHSQR